MICMKQTHSQTQKMGAPRTNLPTVLTSFIGREREITQVTQLLATARLVTLTGAAGCGKSRLALRLLAEVSHSYQDGVYWVELARLMDPALVPLTIAKVLRVPEQPGRLLLDGLLDALHGRQLLLTLDNCEHLLPASAQLVATLLAKTEINILATSREPLGVMGERVFPVAPLSLPPPTLAVDSLDDIAQFEAVQLFIERTRSSLPHFRLTFDNVAAVTKICRQLDGIPLAIELASARLNVLTVEQIAARLDNLFELLPHAAHVAYSHHDTLHAAISWSYDLLSAPEQLLLLRLSVFAGGCSLTTAETVCTGDGVVREQVLTLLASLVNKSLVVADTLQRAEARYALLEPIRQYAQEKLILAGERPLLCDRHLQCFLQLAEDTEPKLSGQFQQLWLEWLEGEYDNIRAALSWSLESDRIETGLRIAVALYQFWTIRDYVAEGLTWIERLLARAGEGISAVVRANALAYGAFLAGFRGKTVAQEAYGREAAILAANAGEEGKPALVWALTAQAYGARAAGDFETEFILAGQVIQLWRELENRYYLGLALSIYSYTAMSVGEYGTARAMLDEALPLLREAGNPYRIAMALNFSGDLARCEGDYVRAQVAYKESMSLLRELDAVRDLASVLHNLGHTCLHLGDVERAHTLFEESMALQQRQQNRPGMAECLIGFAGLAVVRGMPAAGARLLAAAVTIGGEAVASTWPATRLEYEHYLALARASLTEKAFQAQQAAGRALSLEQSVARAREVARKAAQAHKAHEKVGELTAREHEVAVLIARGKSNGEIAAALVVSKRTVEKHVANILSKLRFTNRAQIVRWGIEVGL
jgi:predicted ATPase/DNA-binding CsgD family transcriptional regulator